jgi:toxin ParE1/3/4
VTAAGDAWQVRLAAAAEADIAEILTYTLVQFGDAQVRAYAETLSSALRALTGGPTTPGVKARSDILKGLYSLHVARHGRPGRHFILFRIDRDPGTRLVEVVRVLYDGMDIARHVAGANE